MRRSRKEGPGRRQGGCLLMNISIPKSFNLGGSHGKCKFISGNRKDEIGECHT